MSKRILPLFDRVLVQRVKAIEKTASGILIPEKAQEVLNEGLVIEVGPGLKDAPLAVKKGDKVLLPPFGGNVVKLGQDEYTIFKESEILAKIQ